MSEFKNSLARIGAWFRGGKKLDSSPKPETADPIIEESRDKIGDLTTSGVNTMTAKGNADAMAEINAWYEEQIKKYSSVTSDTSPATSSSKVGAPSADLPGNDLFASDVALSLSNGQSAQEMRDQIKANDQIVGEMRDAASRGRVSLANQMSRYQEMPRPEFEPIRGGISEAELLEEFRAADKRIAAAMHTPSPDMVRMNKLADFLAESNEITAAKERAGEQDAPSGNGSGDSFKRPPHPPSAQTVRVPRRREYEG